MQKIIFDENRTDISIKGNKLNIIICKKAVITLPEVDKFCWVEILFTESGEFNIKSESRKIRFGNLEGNSVTINTGHEGFDTQPRFVYVPQKDSWYYLSQGLLIFSPNKT